MVIADPGRSSDAARILAKVALDEVQVSDNGRHLAAGVSGGTGELATVLAALQAETVDILDIGLRRPTMDDVFLSLTGGSAEGDDEDSDASDEAVA
jgi:ABC-2 type transport system ATP-binding protein